MYACDRRRRADVLADVAAAVLAAGPRDVVPQNLVVRLQLHPAPRVLPDQVLANLVVDKDHQRERHRGQPPGEPANKRGKHGVIITERMCVTRENTGSESLIEHVIRVTPYSNHDN